MANHKKMVQTSIKKNYIYNTIYQVLSLITPLITAPYISRVLGSNGVGIYSYTNSIVTYFTLFAALGTASYGQREIAMHRDDPETSSKLFWEIEILSLTTTAVSLIVWIAWIFISTQYTAIYSVLTLSVLAVAFDISWYFGGFEKFKYIVIRNTLVKITGIILLFLFVKKETDIFLYVGIMAATGLIGNISMWTYLPKLLAKVEFKTLHPFKIHLKQTFAYFIPTVATSVYTVLDKTMIGAITNLNNLPSFYFKEYEEGNIYEFDYFEDLRRFDSQYQGHTHSEIIHNIKLIFRCDEEDIVNFRNVNEGMTNTSFIFEINGMDYIYRHPGDGTDSIISRKNEKNSLIKAKEIGIDPTYIYADINEGWKISVFISEFREPDYNSFKDSKKIISVLRKLHGSGIKVDYGMDPWKDSLKIEKLLRKKAPECFEKNEKLKRKIELLYKKTAGDGVEKCFCHGDTYKSNWMIKPDGNVILIDWEYSGYSDPGIDVGYYIVDAMYDFDEAERFIKEYLQDSYTDKRYYHFWAYTAIIAYYWYVWALYRESCGAVMGDALINWRDMAEKYADHILDCEGE